MALIELEGITRSYWLDGVELPVLRDVRLTVEEGEFIAIVGPSGSGKSTLMQILGLLDRPTRGVYRLSGRDVSRLSDDEGAALRSTTIGFIFQMFNLLPRTSALDNVALPMIYAGVADRAGRARALLAEVGLSNRTEHRPNQLSGGQQQRVAIARALVNRPRLLFADEPTGNLASDQAEEILALLERLNREGLTVILVTHDPEIAARARRRIHIKDGRVVADERKGPDAPVRPQAAAAPAPRRPWGEFLEYGRAAFRAIAANKIRSGLSILGILIGVAAVIAMLAIGQGAQKTIESRLSSLGSNLLLLFPGSPNRGGVRGETGSASRLTLEDVREIAVADPGIRRVDGNVSGGVQAVGGGKNVNTQLTGALPVYAEMRNARAYHGRFFTEEENRSRARVALIGPTVANGLFGHRDPVGESIKINRIGFQVIGVLPLKGSGGFRDQDDVIVVPLATAMNRVLGKKYLNTIAIECVSPEAMAGVQESVRTLMRRRHRLPSHKEDDFDLRNMADIQAALQGTTKTFTALLGIVAAISLFVGGIGIMNIMLVSVSERTREIGLRKAVGAARRAILAQFLMEAALLSLFGGAMGVFFGVSVSLALSALAGWTAVVTSWSVGLAFVFSAGVGVVFGFWPARKASLLSPIEALRYE
jgi:macrolide transport system ATP-binding/permease protein